MSHTAARSLGGAGRLPSDDGGHILTGFRWVLELPADQVSSSRRLLAD
jgi:hypothetical protein